MHTPFGPCLLGNAWWLVALHAVEDCALVGVGGGSDGECLLVGGIVAGGLVVCCDGVRHDDDGAGRVKVNSSAFEDPAPSVGAGAAEGASADESKCGLEIGAVSVGGARSRLGF